MKNNIDLMQHKIKQKLDSVLNDVTELSKAYKELESKGGDDD